MKRVLFSVIILYLIVGCSPREKYIPYLDDYDKGFGEVDTLPRDTIILTNNTYHWADTLIYFRLRVTRNAGGINILRTDYIEPRNRDFITWKSYPLDLIVEERIRKRGGG